MILIGRTPYTFLPQTFCGVVPCRHAPLCGSRRCFPHGVCTPAAGIQLSRCHETFHFRCVHLYVRIISRRLTSGSDL
nr:MAG TPA: hypothetical protein [Caudoviricetes sp.]